MDIDPSKFHLANIADTCAVWNVLSSKTLYQAARAAGVQFGCTQFVLYECLYKRRRNKIAAEEELMARLHNSRSTGNKKDFINCQLGIDDLQAVELLERRKRLGLGELSSIAFASKAARAFLTDDMKARKLAREILRNGPGEQTTPHLFAWLYYTNRLGDSDKDVILAEHESCGRPLKPHLEKAYEFACQCKLMVKKQ